MDYSELKRLAEEATAGPWKFSQKWADHINAEDGDICMLTDNLFSGFTRPLLDRRNNATYIAAASPDVVLGLIAQNQAFLYQVLEALSACDIYAYAGGEGLMSTKHTDALKAIRTRLGLLK